MHHLFCNHRTNGADHTAPLATTAFRSSEICRNIKNESSSADTEATPLVESVSVAVCMQGSTVQTLFQFGTSVLYNKESLALFTVYNIAFAVLPAATLLYVM